MTYEEAERINPGAAWDKLPPHAQRAFGVAALTMIISARAQDQVDNYIPAMSVAEARGFEEMENVVEEHIARGDGEMQVIDTATIGLPSCLRCGCTETSACAEVCAWTDDTRTLCTACAPRRCELVNA